MKLEALTRQQLAKLYNIDVKTLMTKLKKANISLESGLIYPAKLEEIFELLGDPRGVS